MLLVRTLNAPGSGAVLARPPNTFISPSSSGYQDLDIATAAAVDGLGYVAAAYVGSTAQRPAGGVPQPNAFGISVFIDTSLNLPIAMDGSGVWRSLLTGAAV